jgi:hypothetical protein
MILSAARPYFCPHPGYFARILASDCFVVLDTVQFPRGTTWVTRNRFKNDQGALWLTVAVRKKGLGLQKISDVQVCRDERWRRKHLASLRQAYRDAPYLEEHLGIFERLFLSGPDSLCEMNVEFITHVLAELGCATRVVRLSETGVAASGTRLLVDLCRVLGADRFLVQDSARKWLDARLFEEAAIGISSVNSCAPVYPQHWGAFIQNTSVFDLLFTCGPRARQYLR